MKRLIAFLVLVVFVIPFIPFFLLALTILSPFMVILWAFETLVYGKPND